MEYSSIQNRHALHRHIPLKGSYNIRDIGGYATEHGHTTRWRWILRADRLSDLPVQEQRILLDLPVRTIIDVRRQSEVAHTPDVFAQSHTLIYRHIPLLEDPSVVARAQTLQELYQAILDTCQTRMRDILELLATGTAFPCVIHCTAGKDRTGLIIALLLSIANVPMETIADDYALSEMYLRPFYASKLHEYTLNSDNDRQRFARLTAAPREVMLDTFTYLTVQYGSVTTYLQSIGLTQHTLDALRNIFARDNI